MDKRTLTALQGSIAKWEAIVWDGGFDQGIENCPLCQLFVDNDCEGCPVAGRTGQSGCDGSPYMEFSNAFTNATGEMFDAFVLDEATHKAAKAELAFLKSLLP